HLDHARRQVGEGSRCGEMARTGLAVGRCPGVVPALSPALSRALSLALSLTSSLALSLALFLGPGHIAVHRARRGGGARLRQVSDTVMVMAETPTVSTGSSVVRDLLVDLGAAVRDDFTRNRRVMSFAEYLNLVVSDPMRQLRSSTQYIVDCLDHYGTSTVKYPWGEVRRFHLFDAPWALGEDRLFGQEPVQNAVYRVL